MQLVMLIFCFNPKAAAINKFYFSMIRSHRQPVEYILPKNAN